MLIGCRWNAKRAGSAAFAGLDDGLTHILGLQIVSFSDGHRAEFGLPNGPDAGVYYDDDGHADLRRVAAPDIGAFRPQPQVSQDLELLTNFAATVVHTFALFHSRGVIVREASLSRGARRRLQPKLASAEKIRIKWIDIDPDSDPSNPEHRGRLPAYMPLHLVRGNYAIYTKERPLFGWFVGQIWRPQHLRGNKGFGEIDHRYAIKEPA